MMMALFLQLRGWVNAAGLLLMLSAAGCATSPAPQVAAPPPGQARIWFYRLWNPSESLNVANIDVNGVYLALRTDTQRLHADRAERHFR
jgi:hypothetical protein